MVRVVTSDSEFWDRRDQELAHKDGRAKGGEPCIICGQPIQGNAHWKYRDRHVCSQRCNKNLKRRTAGKEAAAIARAAAAKAPPRPNPRRAPQPAVFEGREEPPDEFDGFGPVHNDLVIRDGHLTHYAIVPKGVFRTPSGSIGPFQKVTHVQSGHFALVGMGTDGLFTPVFYGLWSADEVRLKNPPEAQFEWEGEPVKLTKETIRHWDAELEVDYQWVAWIFVHPDAPSRSGLWTEEFTNYYKGPKPGPDRSRGSRIRYVRVREATVEHFSSREIFRRDNWICGICGEPIDKALLYPDPGSVSLDHVVPILAGGAHSRANTQAAHLGCNMRKGASLDHLS